MMIAAFVFLFSLSIPAPVFTAQMMMGADRAKTAGSTATKIAPARAKTVHKATPKSLLVVKDISIKPENPQLGDKVAIHAIVANNGLKAVEGVKVAFYLGRQQVAWQTYDIKSKGKQAYVGYFTKKQAPKAGTYTISVLVDPNRTLERVFYKCNSATMKVTLTAMIKNTRTRTVKKPRIHPRTVKTVGKTTSNNSHKMNTTQEIPGHINKSRKRLPTGEITNVTVKIKTQAVLKARQRQKSHVFDIRWTRKGILPSHVDIFLYPYRQFHSGMYLKRNVGNNGHVFLPVPERVNPQKEYIVRVQAHDGKIYGESKGIRFAPTVALMPRKVLKVKTNTKTGRNAKLKVRQPASQIKLESGIGPNHARSNTPVGKAAFKKGLTLPGKMTTYDFIKLVIVDPKKDVTWLNNKEYAIHFSFLGGAATLESVILKGLSKSTTPKFTIYPSKLAKSVSGGILWKVPKSIKKGEYLIHIKAKTSGGKILKADSDKFNISWTEIGKALLFKDLLADAMPTLLNYAKNMPMITYFDYSKTVKGCSGLRIQFYWKDRNKNLYGGRWVFEDMDQYGNWHTKGNPIAKLPYPSDFQAAQGLCKYTIPFCEISGKATPFRFYLVDATGIKGNVISGTANAENEPKAKVPPPAKLLDAIEFINPPKYRKLVCFAGEPISVQFKLNMDKNIKTVPITIDVFKGITKNGKFTGKFKAHITPPNKKMINDGKLKTVNWTIPASFKSGEYNFVATSSKVKAKIKSNHITVANEAIKLLAPSPGATYHFGDIVVFKWKPYNLPATAKMLLMAGSGGSGVYGGVSSSIPVIKGSYQIKLTPDAFPEGKVEIEFVTTDLVTKYATTSINISYAKKLKPPKITFEEPAPWQKTTWMAGTSEKIVWTKNLGFPSNKREVVFYLESVGKKMVTTWPLSKQTILPSTPFRQEMAVKIPASLAPGPYQILAKFGYAGTVGKSSVIEVTNPNMDMLPAPGTTFEITSVKYPGAGSTVTVNIKVNAPRPFRLSSKGDSTYGSQYLVYWFSNYDVFTLSNEKDIGTGPISVMKNPSVFPKYVFPKGISTYSITFKPKLIGKFLSVTVRREKNEIQGSWDGSLPPTEYNYCRYYYPKLEIGLASYLSTGKRYTSKNHIVYLKNAPGMTEETQTLLMHDPQYQDFDCKPEW